MVRCRTLRLFELLIVCSCSVLAVPSLAFRGERNPGPDLTPLSGDASLQTDASEPGAFGVAGWQQFATRHGAWRGLWSPNSTAPHRASGPPIRLEGFRDEATAVDQAVRRFIAQHPQLFGEALDLETLAVRREGNVWYVRYGQRVDGLPVLFQDWEFRVSANGRLFAFGADPVRAAPDAGRAAPRVSDALARATALRGLPGQDHQVEPDAVLCLVPSHGAEGTRLVYRIHVRSSNPPARWLTMVDAIDGEILMREDLTRRMISGNAHGDVHLDGPLGPTTMVQFPYQSVETTTQQVFTDEKGEYSVSASQPTSITARLSGLYCLVYRFWNSQSVITSVGPVSDPSTFNITWESGNSSEDERDVYYHVSRAHDEMKVLGPEFAALDYPMPCIVEAQVGSVCNAVYDGTRLVFFPPSGGCTSLAHMSDVIYHEYGHAITDKIYRGNGAPSGLVNPSLHEALSDVFAAYVLDRPRFGVDYAGPGTWMRDLSELRRWPQDGSRDRHQGGLILGGAYWDLKREVGREVAARLFHRARYGLPDDPNDGRAMVEFWLETVIADDDDGDLTNGTPHYAAIARAFNRHGIGPATLLQVTHVPPLESTLLGPIALVVDLQNAAPVHALGPEAVQINYRVDVGAMLTRPMAQISPTRYTFLLPPSAGQLIRYWVSVEDAFGGVSADPPQPNAGQVHALMPPPFLVEVEDPAEQETGWAYSAPGDDAISGFWIRSNPNGTFFQDGTPLQPEDDHTLLGTACYVTGNAAPGSLISLNDVDEGRVTLVSRSLTPRLTTARMMVVEYYRWFATDDVDDRFIVDVSGDGGVTWTNVETQRYSDPAWRRVSLPLLEIAPTAGSIKLRFVAWDRNQPSLCEAGVDDLRLAASQHRMVDIAETVPSPSFAPHPNPFESEIRLAFTSAADAPVSMRIYDITGRRIRTLIEGSLPGGEHAVRWDGRDEGGVLLPAGLYFARLETPGFDRVERLVKLR